MLREEIARHLESISIKKILISTYLAAIYISRLNI